MTRAENELDEFGKRVLAPLRPVPPVDPQVAAEAKMKYLLQGEHLRQELISQSGGIGTTQVRRKPNILQLLQHKPMMKALFAILLAVVIILAGSSFTVYAAQSSLPGEPLYTLKSWSEDVRLSMTFSTKAKLKLTLDYTNRRVDEISSLLAGGKALNDQTSNRFQRELEDALQLAAQLDDTQIQNALSQIRSHAEHQGRTMEGLLGTLPPQAKSAILHLQERLDEQVDLSTIGKTDPHEFRLQISGRHQKRQGPNHKTDTDESQFTPAEPTVTSIPAGDGDNHRNGGNGNDQSTEVPGNGGQENGQGQSTPGNGNHGPNEIHTPKP